VGHTLQLNMPEATDLTSARHAFKLRYWAALAAPAALFYDIPQFIDAIDAQLI
jgi:hypothetical protein